MKRQNILIQVDANARATAVRNSGVDCDEEIIHIGPANVRSCGAVKSTLQGYSLFCDLAQ